MTKDYGWSGTGVSEEQQCIPLTVLRRPCAPDDGNVQIWKPIEVTILCTHLGVPVIGDPRYREYLVVKGHHPPERTFPTAGFRDTPHTVQHVYGPKSKHLPFIPRIV